MDCIGYRGAINNPFLRHLITAPAGLRVAFFISAFDSHSRKKCFNCHPNIIIHGASSPRYLRFIFLSSKGFFYWKSFDHIV
jgi:hypothetical protein